jgi:YVTN family beta-propeller protein
MARISILVLAAALAIVLNVAPSRAQNAYITNETDGTVSVIATASNTVTATIPVGTQPYGTAVTPDGSKVYVANMGANTVSVIATATNTVIATIPGFSEPFGVAVTPDGSKVYVSNFFSNTVSVIATASNTVIGSPITVGSHPQGIAMTPDGSTLYIPIFPASVAVIATASDTVVATVGTGVHPAGAAVTPDGSKVYITNRAGNTVAVIATASNTVTATINGVNVPNGVAVTPDGSAVYVANQATNNVSVIATATNTIVATIPAVGSAPLGLAVSPDGSRVYVVNSTSNNVSVITTASNTVTAIVGVGNGPVGFGSFIGPPTLTVAETGTGSGQVSSSPANITCGGGGTQCAAMFPDGTQVTLTATAVAGSSFAGWSGGGCSGTSTCVITPTVDTTVTATFNPLVTLTVTEAGTGSGQVTSSPTGINCSASSNQCAFSFVSGTMVTLTASASAGSSFTGWSGGRVRRHWHMRRHDERGPERDRELQEEDYDQDAVGGAHRWRRGHRDEHPVGDQLRRDLRSEL